MRIISGKFRKKKLISVPGQSTRPTSDRLRETLFNIIAGKSDGAFVLDLFAGTGALGLEALSRGAEQAVFIDVAPKAVSVIRKNISACSMENQAVVYKWDILKNLNCLNGRTGIDLVFMDPPYLRNMIERPLSFLDRTGALADGADIIVEHAASEAFTTDSDVFQLTDSRTYGKSALSFLTYQKKPR